MTISPALRPRRISPGLLALILTLALPATADDFWPKTLTGEQVEIVIYQPQVESLDGRQLESRAAVMVTEKGAEPVFGAVWFSTRLATDQDARTATLEDVKVADARFPDVAADKVERLSRYLEQEIPTWDLEISLDRIVADLAADGTGTGGDSGYENAPPRIFVRDHPTVLVIIEGDPIFEDLDGPPLEYVVNSAFFIVREPGKQPLYLRGSGMWFTADALAGPWRAGQELPAAVAGITAQLEEEEKKQQAEATEDAEALGIAQADDTAPPEIIVSTEPAEVIVTEGEADFAPIQGTQLLYVTNTESDVAMDIASQQYFVLLAGRWYTAPSLDAGPWTYVEADDLPADFAAIPADSDLATVLPSVPGTQQAREAVLDNTIPQTAEVDRKTATVTVSYDGDPEFDACGEGVAYARNADKSVLLIGDRYYCCDEAIWFVATRPDGPWQVATELPAVIQDLPPDCPVYNVKYVHIYESTPEVVYVGYTPGYYGCYNYRGRVIYGTGWWYRPWYGVHYYPRPVTYGFGVHYSPWSGWGFSFGLSYGWLHVGVGWGRPAYRWGPGGYRYGYRHGYWRGYNHGYRHGYNRGAAAGFRAGYHAGQRHPSNNIYRHRAKGVRRTGDLNRHDRRQPTVSDRRNNVYADRDGNIYRDRDGKWEKRENGEWRRDEARPQTRENQRDANRDRQPATRDQTRDQTRDLSRDRQTPQTRPQQIDRGRTPPSSSRQQLNRDRNARNRGAQLQRQAPRSAPRGGAQRGAGRR